MESYPAICTGCHAYVYADEQAEPCQNCFPGLTRASVLKRIDELVEEVAAEHEAGTLPPLSVADADTLRRYGLS